MGDAESTNYIFPYKALHLLGGNGCQQFDLNPLCKIINTNQEELALPLSRGKRPYDVHTPHCKGPRRCDVVQCLWSAMYEVFELLTFLTLSGVLCTVSLHGWPVIPDPENPSKRTPSFYMEPAYSLV